MVWFACFYGHGTAYINIIGHTQDDEVDDNHWIFSVPGKYNLFLTCTTTWNDPTGITFGIQLYKNDQVIYYFYNEMEINYPGPHVRLVTLDFQRNDVLKIKYTSYKVNGFIELFCTRNNS